MSAGTTGDKKSAVSGCTSSLYDSVNKLSNTSTYEPRKYKCPGSLDWRPHASFRPRFYIPGFLCGFDQLLAPLAPRSYRRNSQLNGSFICPKCSNRYVYKHNLKQHLKFECGVEPQFKCPYCDKRCKLKGNLMSHIALKHT
ncbi:zinc finger protein 425-like [Diaphorina citri]|uniref:Zinc finger protein 425-like n=1 Tax=Diaphorina citri TaxID=121845 RepID=A0A3Q0II98_DIACI|nr:zinc finger protein 425-like [Diaphorina citri]